MGKDEGKNRDNLVETLRRVKEKEKISIRDLADELGVNYQTVFRWFHGIPPSNLSRRVIKQWLADRLWGE
jgi:transcriptional regulator with XRE-family HTH domain